MISSTYKSFVWLWMAALLSASIGVSVQQVYCYCVGTTTVTLFTAEDVCHAGDMDPQAEDIDRVTSSHPVNILRLTMSHPVNKNDCCKKTAPAKKSCCEKPGSEKQGCTKKTTKVFQLKTEFEVVHSEFKKIDFPKNWAIAPEYLASLPAILGLQKVDFHGFKRPPPPLSGRMICVRHGVFLC